MRLDRYLSNANVGSRKEVGKLIKKGVVTVNGKVIKSLKEDVSYNDEVRYGEEYIQLEEYIYFMMNKPKDVISSTEEGPTSTVIDLIQHPQKGELFPVGRLDKDTTGLLLVTNDGKLAHKLTSPKKEFGKTYVVTLNSDVSEVDLQQLREGVPLKDFKTKPAEVVKLDNCKVCLTITEGKFHQVKRMFRYLGTEVIDLKRTAFASLTLDQSLGLGDYRNLSKDEINILRKMV